IYVLQGLGTYSAALQVAWYLKIATPNCWLVGDMVGQYNPLCGNIAVIELPYTKTYMSIATTKNLILHGLPEENGFLLPDILFEFQVSDSFDIEELKQIIKEVEEYEADKI
ncbi:MAG: hypothetical protein LIO65_00770, partial [Odoribacter sp.]|nr:hypothetical protein [Odoribacter sp.]